MVKSLTLNAKDPDQLEEMLQPFSGEATIQAIRAAPFKANANLYPFENSRLFFLNSDPIRVATPPPYSICAVTIPLNYGFNTNDQGQRSTFFGNTAHLLQPYEPFEFSAPSGCQVMVANFDSDTVFSYATKLNGSELYTERQTNFSLSFMNPAGYHLFRVLACTCSEIHSGNIYKSEIALKEMEDNVITAFIIALQEMNNDACATPAQLRRAEEYLAANLSRPVTRAELAEHAGASIRTLSRGFMKRHNVGPMTFLKGRRLDAVYRMLLYANADTTYVTNVALSFGFTHLGNFALDYKKAFGESPSTTLRKRVM